MTTIAQARTAAIKGVLLDTWAPAQGINLSRIELQNEGVKPGPPIGSAPWFRVADRPGPRRQECLGGPGARRFVAWSILFIQIFVPFGGGTLASSTLAQSLVDVFEGVQIVGLEILSADVRDIGPDGQWYSTNVEITYQYRETK